MRNKRLRDKEGRRNMGSDNALPFLDADIKSRFAHLDTRVVYKNIHTLTHRDNFSDIVFYFFFFGYIGNERIGYHTGEFGDFFCRRLCVFLIYIPDDNIGTGPRQHCRKTLTDSPPASGDHRRLSL
ncbi:hypothetical protein SDC9_167746 [bioreactor metagenome]|uniref:Uncharacterized protein n=1 Tax=bioreactor metagenome TaxID=1076179 RepID=A0A645G0L1_9ZZZZ